jgi:tetratricopeptide (TPR) repeat protein
MAIDMRLFSHGIGFIYFGSKNFQSRTGPCPHCRRTGRLSSYDTRKWFVFALIPIVPLEHLRIIDHCRICSRNLAIPLGSWENAKQSGISTALSKYQLSPTAEAAVTVHEQLLSFHQPQAAETFRKQACSKFPDDAKMHAHFGTDLEGLGLFAQADECFQRAHALCPNLPGARLGWAGGLIRAGRLNEARALLDFLEIPGAAKIHPIEPLYQLTLAYQNANQHEAALELFAVLVREQPHLRENVLFRDRLQESERSIPPKNEPESLTHLSGRRHAGNSGKIIKVGTAIIGGALLIAAISNEFIRRQRDLYVVNPYGQAATPTNQRPRIADGSRLGQIFPEGGHVSSTRFRTSAGRD